MSRALSEPRLTRRHFVAAAGAWGLLPATGVSLPGSAQVPLARAPQVAYRFFNPVEAAIVEAACERLIPAGASSPGAQGAGVPLYLDQQLAGPWGNGERIYRPGAWQPGTPWFDPSRPSSPRHYFRAALLEIHRQFASRGIAFATCVPAVQDAYLRSLASGNASLRPLSARGFFDLFSKMTLEGYFLHPQSDSSPRMLAWTMTGFPGACVHDVRDCSTPAATFQSQR